MNRSDRIIVIGAGPVGLCLSLALAQEGIAVTLVETLGDDNFLEQVPRAGTNHPATLEMFERSQSWRLSVTATDRPGLLYALGRVFAEHEGADARRVRPEREDENVEHQLQMQVGQSANHRFVHFLVVLETEARIFLGELVELRADELDRDTGVLRGRRLKFP